MKIVNQKPAILTPFYNDDIKDDMDCIDLMKQCCVTPLFQPLIPSSPVQMTENNKQYTEDMLTTDFVTCCGESVNNQSETLVKNVLGQTLISYNAKTNLGVIELFPVQAGTKEGMDEPSSNIIYTPAGDVIPMCRQFLGGTASYEQFFASLAYYARPETLGFYFANEIAWDSFIQWCQNQFAGFSQVLSAEANKLCADFITLKLSDLTESIILRKDDSDSREPYSFARLIVKLLMQYSKIAGPAEFGCLPFNLGELICPKTLVFVNVEKHSKATARAVADEWKLINTSIANKNQIKMISNKKLTRLTAMQKNLKHATQAAAAAAQQAKMAGVGKVANFKFSKTRPTRVDLTRIVKKIMDKMAFINTSMNTFKQSKLSFAKPNRRDPDDYNKQGKVVSTKYRPDIHLYIDTSGSISERDYMDTVKACIKLAQKLNVNMYFNSFSHYMSQIYKLNVMGKSLSAIYAEFQKIPKVSGGTDYEQIWHFINKSKKRKRELSIIITDFEYYPPNRFIEHPKNLYYVPCSTMNWQSITYHAEKFCKGMVHNDPAIRKHILF